MKTKIEFRCSEEEKESIIENALNKVEAYVDSIPVQE